MDEVALAQGTPDMAEGICLPLEHGKAAIEQLRAFFGQTRLAMCITDPHLRDNPVVMANAAFERLTGYHEDEIVGRNCRFLQGDGTDVSSIRRLRQRIEAGRTCILELTNYRKDGTPFRNALHVGPIHDHQGRLRFFFGSQWDATPLHEGDAACELARRDTELNAGIRNLFAVLGSIATVSATGSPERSRGRIAALGKVHEASPDPSTTASCAKLRTLVERVVRPFIPRDIRPITIKGPDTLLKTAAITPLALLLHELAASSARAPHASEAQAIIWHHVTGPSGRPTLRLTWRGGGELEGAGRQIVDTVANHFEGSLHVEAASDTPGIRLDLPLETLSPLDGAHLT